MSNVVLWFCEMQKRKVGCTSYISKQCLYLFMQNVHLVILVIAVLRFALPHIMVLGVVRNVIVQHVIIFMAAFKHVQ